MFKNRWRLIAGFNHIRLADHFVKFAHSLCNLRFQVKAAARGIIEKVGLKDRWSHYPAQLSGGEKQRVAIARAFATEPAVLFADEPTGNLDSRTGENIMQLMFELNRNSATTLILVTHDGSLAERCERVLELDTGELKRDSRAAA